MRKKSNRNNQAISQVRQLLAKEAARLMYEEHVPHYLDAKKIATKRVFGKGGVKAMRYRPQDLPSNGEISNELANLVALYEDDQPQRLAAMRQTALAVMHALLPFHPRLIGSVSTGRIREGSDIDLHVFTDHVEKLQCHLDKLQWRYQQKEVLIRHGNQFREYTHFYIDTAFPVELSVYPELELRVTGRSSTDAKPIKRLTIADVARL